MEELECMEYPPPSPLISVMWPPLLMHGLTSGLFLTALENLKKGLVSSTNELKKSLLVC